ncbi:MAG: hypothetical protein CMC79_03425 [Flavobacteriaceae bacterium]|nr:hypothetical protein [Flavobacteriaceae bacterium]|tara:strand:- start:27075 stop:27656 length:582 start_codon:yes stop_codon:yes gene_type:complete
MVQIEKTLVSDLVLSEEFVCNISKCKGACCVAGSAGAPLEFNEIKKIDQLYENISPFLSKEGRKSINKQGKYLKTNDGKIETPLIDNKECAYAVFDKSNNALCGIEIAYNSGAINWQKPISCHLYPIRVEKFSEYTAVNYHNWSICNSACSLGASLKIPVYKFLKVPLIRKFGKLWYKKLLLIAKEFQKTESQ